MPHAHTQPADLRPPSPWLMLMEARAPWEYASLVALWPLLHRLPAGDGHPVVVFPGLGAPDLSTWPLRRLLHKRGYSAYAWNLGLNLGPRKGVIEACRAHVRQVVQRHGRPASLIGWSLGGVYARELAKEMPQAVRSVITLGTPFAGHPHATNAYRFFELVSGQKPAQDAALLAQLREPPPQPTTSIFSRTDGVVAWPCSLNDERPHTENIEVPASHMGMGMNPLALYAVADRLAQPPGAWKPFDVAGARSLFYRRAPGAPSA